MPQNEPPNEPQNDTFTARAHGPRVRRPPPSEVDTLKQPRPQIQSQVPTSRPPADVRPAPPVHVPPARISGSSALERPFVDRTPSQVRSRPESHDEDVTAQRNLADFPGMGFDTKRAMSVVARGQNMHGEPVVLDGTALLARAVQHETDHLDGVLFIDRLDPARRREAMKAIRGAEWFGANPPVVKVSPHRTFGLGL